MVERGIIITPPIKILEEGGLLIESSEISSEQLRFSLFFWDKIDWPQNNLISIGADSPDLQFLTECGIFNRTNVRLNGSFSGADAMLHMQDIVLKDKNRTELGLWSIERIGNKLIPMTGLTTQSKSIEFELYDSIPVPHRDVPLHDILEFKEKYSSELIALRCSLDEMYLAILKSPDPIVAKHIALTRLTNTISDVHKAMKSKSICRSLTNYKVVLNDFNDVWDTVTRGYGVYELSRGLLGDNLAGLVGIANAMFKISARENPMSFGLPKELKDYAYLAKIKHEFL